MAMIIGIEQISEAPIDMV